MGSPGTISVKFSVDVSGWPRYQIVYKHCGKFQLTEYGVRTLQMTDTTDGQQHIANFTFTFTSNDTLRPFWLLELSVANSGRTFVFVIKVFVNNWWWELLTISITFWGLHYWLVHSFFVFECVIENVCGWLFIVQTGDDESHTIWP